MSERREIKIMERPPELTPVLLSTILFDPRLKNHEVADSLVSGHVQLANLRNGDLAVGLWLLALSHVSSLEPSSEAVYSMLQFGAALTKGIGGKLLNGILQQSIVTKTYQKLDEGKSGWF